MKLRNIASIVSLGSLLLIGACNGGSTPKAVAEEFYGALFSQDFNKARELATAESAPMIGMMEAMMSQGGKVSSTEATIGECVVEETKASCETLKDGKSGEKMNLVLIDGAWKVNAVKAKHSASMNGSPVNIGQ